MKVKNSEIFSILRRKVTLLKIRYRWNLLKKLLPYTSGVKLNFLLVFLCGLITVITSFLIPQLYKQFINEVIIKRDFALMFSVVVGYVSLFILDTVTLYLHKYNLIKLVQTVTFQIKHEILKNYLEIPFHDYSNLTAGDVKMRVEEDVDKLKTFGHQQTIHILLLYLKAVLAVIAIFLIEWRLALFSVLVIPVTFFLDHKISQKEKVLQDINRNNREEWMTWMDSSIQGWKEIKALNLQKKEARKFAHYAHNYAEFFSRWINYWVIRVLVIPKIVDEFLMKFSLYFFGGLLIMSGKLTIGNLLVFALYYDMLSRSIRKISFTNAELQSNTSFYERVFESLQNSNNDRIETDLINHIDCIEMKNISFGYNSKPIIDKFSLSIKRGEKIAVIGKSGSGKSTLIKLMLGMLQPDEGEILYNDTSLHRINEKSLFQRIGCIMQDDLLFNLSIMDNLKLSKPNATIDEIEKACKKACIYDFVQSLPKTYDTFIGERGVKLSGGQKQRLLLARMFLSSPDVLIFDEATSAVDQASENLIHEAILNMGKDVIVIVIAHRQSSIALCDRVIKIKTLSA